jgi:hypothetical protein
MTEAEWLLCEDPGEMLTSLAGRVSARKLRLFAVALARLCPAVGARSISVDAIAVAERYADGFASERERREAELLAAMIARQDSSTMDCQVSMPWEELAHVAQLTVAADVSEYTKPLSRLWAAACGAISREVLSGKPRKEAMGPVCDILRDIVGNPFQPARVEEAWFLWNDWTTVKIAQAIYDDRAFEQMPLLADALEDAGCDDAQILSHCRGPSPHARGCFVLDLLTFRQ